MLATLFSRNRRPGPILTILLPALLLAAGAPAAMELSVNTVTRRWNHEELYDQGARRGVAASVEGLVLDTGILVEDDAPACGFSNVSGSENILRPGIVLRKTLLVDRWPVGGAEIVMPVYPVQPARAEQRPPPAVQGQRPSGHRL